MNKNEYIPVTERFLNETFDFWMQRTPKPDEVLTVPPFYVDWQGNRNATYNISMDTWASAELALVSKFLPDPKGSQAAQRSIEIITSWAKTNKGAGNKEGRLYLVSKGSLFLEAYNLVKGSMNSGDDMIFHNWIESHYLPNALKLKDRFLSCIRANNINSEGWLGYIHAKVALGEDIGDDFDKFVKFIKSQIDQGSGKIKKEIWRTNSGPWYCYANLVALMRTHLLFYKETNFDAWDYIKPGVEWYSKYVKYPDSWPYLLPGTNTTGFLKPFAKAVGWIWKLMFPCSEELQKATPGSWPADLFETILTYNLYMSCFTLNDINEWLENGHARPLSIGNVFRQTTSLWCRDALIYV